MYVHVWTGEVGLSVYVYIITVTPLSLQSTGWSALFFAAKEGDVGTTNLLLKAGAIALLKDKVSSTQISVWYVAVL